ncbi:MAG TPA: hypothetical protein VHS06_08890 [Chloroflexota bacterium]|nr:hypothetical protein [Chloroflexota bacterium]
MAYNWAQLAFVEKWRLSAVRGPLVGMYRPADKTYFDLRLHSSEGGARSIPGTVEIHLIDAGDIIREKRIALLETRPVIVRVVTAGATITPSSKEVGSAPPRGRRWLEPGSKITGSVLQTEDDTALVDVGFPVVVQLPEGQGASAFTGHKIEFEVSETPRGFLVV